MTFGSERREWKGKEKGRSEDSCGENSIFAKIAFNLRLISHLGQRARLDSLILDGPSRDGRDSWVAASLLLWCFYVHRAFNTPETVITLRGIAVNCIVDL